MTAPILLIPRTTSATDPAFHADVAEMARLARQLLDRLELLEDTAPHDLPAETRPALAAAATAASRTHDILRYLVDPTAPKPENLNDEGAPYKVRTWRWRTTTLELQEQPGWREGTCSQGEAWVMASWTHPLDGGTLDWLEVSCISPMLEGQPQHHAEILWETTLTLPWEVGAIRRLSQRGALPACLHLLLRQLLIAGLEQDASVPPIAVQRPTPRTLAEVADA